MHQARLPETKSLKLAPVGLLPQTRRALSRKSGSRGVLLDPAATARHWREVCRREGIGEIFLSFMLGFESPKPWEIGFDAAIQMPPLGCGAPVLNNQLDLHDPERFAGEVRDYRHAVASLPFEDFGPSGQGSSVHSRER